MPLMIGRKKGQAVIITTADGDRVRLSIGSIEGKTATLLFVGPKRVSIWREELTLTHDDPDAEVPGA